MGRVSRNSDTGESIHVKVVTPRMGRVSRNIMCKRKNQGCKGHAPHGACE